MANDSETLIMVTDAPYFSARSKAKSSALSEFSDPSTATKTFLININPQNITPKIAIKLFLENTGFLSN